jgi:hypothetical protein
MSEQESGQQYNDGLADAVAMVAIIAISVATFVFWLGGQ